MFGARKLELLGYMTIHVDCLIITFNTIIQCVTDTQTRFHSIYRAMYDSSSGIKCLDAATERRCSLLQTFSCDNK